MCFQQLMQVQGVLSFTFCILPDLLLLFFLIKSQILGLFYETAGLILENLNSDTFFFFFKCRGYKLTLALVCFEGIRTDSQSQQCCSEQDLSSQKHTRCSVFADEVKTASLIQYHQDFFFFFSTKNTFTFGLLQAVFLKMHGCHQKELLFLSGPLVFQRC